jgi:hypothetical protein
MWDLDGKSKGLSYGWEHFGSMEAGCHWVKCIRMGLHIHVAAGVAVHPHKECPRPGPPRSPAGAATDEVPGASAAAGRGEQGG